MRVRLHTLVREEATGKLVQLPHLHVQYLDRGIAQLEKNRKPTLAYRSHHFAALLYFVFNDWLPLFEAASSAKWRRAGRSGPS